MFVPPPICLLLLLLTSSRISSVLTLAELELQPLKSTAGTTQLLALPPFSGISKSHLFWMLTLELFTIPMLMLKHSLSNVHQTLGKLVDLLVHLLWRGICCTS